MTRPRHSRLTEAAVASLQDALQHVTDALSAVRDPDYFEDEPDRRTDCGQHRETAGANCGRRAPQDGTQ